ncbi:7tm 6 domain containing protein, partial [Asbolus verrucosus]
MERLNWKEIIKADIIMLKITGLWPAGDETYGCNLYTLYAIVSTILFQFGHNLFQTINLFTILDDLQAITGTIFILMMELSSTLKTYYLVKNMKMLKQLMLTINCDLFQPKNFEQRMLIQPTINAWKTFTFTYLTFTAPALFFWSMYPVFDRTVKNYRLPFLAWYPYNTKISPLYELTYIHQALSIVFIAVATMGIDNLIAALNMFIAAQLDILSNDLKNLNRVNNNNNSVDVVNDLKQCVHHHREILKFADNANQFYNWLLLVQFFVGGVSIGLSMFQLTLVIPLSTEFYMLLTYGGAVLVQGFMYCWFGNEIEVKSNVLSYAVFECDWTGLPPEIMKNFIILVLRLQRPLKIAALNLFYLSLATYVKILKTSWSYFALLRQVNSP